MMQTIKELFTATYENGKISGCREYSFAWYHEYRHKTQMEIKLLNRIWVWLPYVTAVLGIVMLWFVYLVPEKETLIWGGIFILPLSLFVLAIEIDANLYAVIKKAEGEKMKPWIIFKSIMVMVAAAIYVSIVEIIFAIKRGVKWIIN